MQNGEDTIQSPAKETVEVPTMEGDDVLHCSNCGTSITREKYGFSKDGSFVHTFANPSGYVFRIGCFSSAPGAWIVGEYNTEFSWFRGFAWCYLLCEGCNIHLGWHFSSSESAGFHGIILDRIGK